MYNNQSPQLSESFDVSETQHSHFGPLSVDANHQTTGRKSKDPLIPNEKFIYNFRPEWEDIFRSLDDKLIELFQRYHLKRPGPQTPFAKGIAYLMKAFAWSVTFVSRIENLSSVCLFVFALGYDYIGRFMTIVGIISGLAAQVPKRFLFRKRPYMVGRALPSGKLDTSSFPSRAVTCSVVYMFTAIFCYNALKPYDQLGYVSSSLLILLAFLSSSFARIHLGAHYPSDCLGGLILGLFISFTSYVIFQMNNIFGCPDCLNDQCYPTDINRMMDNTNFELQNLMLSIIVMGATGLLLVLSSCPPLVFWNKSAPIFGTIVTCVVVELLMVCPKDNAKGLKLPIRNNFSFLCILLASAVAGFQLIVAFFAAKAHKKTRNKSLAFSSISNLMIYLFFSLGLLIVLVNVRLAIIGKTTEAK